MSILTKVTNKVCTADGIFIQFRLNFLQTIWISIFPKKPKLVVKRLEWHYHKLNYSASRYKHFKIKQGGGGRKDSMSPCWFCRTFLLKMSGIISQGSNFLFLPSNNIPPPARNKAANIFFGGEWGPYPMKGSAPHQGLSRPHPKICLVPHHDQIFFGALRA